MASTSEGLGHHRHPRHRVGDPVLRLTIDLLIQRALDLPEEVLDELAEAIWAISREPHHDEPHLYYVEISKRLGTIYT